MPPLRRTFAVANFNDQKEYPPPAPERFEQRQRMHQPPLSLPAVAADSPSGVFAAVFMSLASVNLGSADRHWTVPDSTIEP